MENILKPDNFFDFSNISLAHPTGIQGGAYFTKIQFNSKPLYIETPKSLSKQGFVQNGKKIYCDLMFDNNDEEFIRWLENLENKCQELIYNKSDTWFENKLELNDIETAFASPMRVYKSGKYYLVRVNVKINYNTNIPNIKIYNESETPLTVEEVTCDNYMISILEVQGIKFTSRNFQIEIELKQAMVLSSEKIFENCLIKRTTQTDSTNKIQHEHNVNKTEQNVFSIKSDILENLENTEKIENIKKIENIANDLEEINQDQSLEETKTNINNINDLTINAIETDKNKTNNETNISINSINSIDSKTLSSNEKIELDLNLTEVKIPSDLDNLETITLKKPNQVYYEIYKTARKKAKEAKRLAILAFLEAKNIKKTYMLEKLDDDIDDSDDSDYDMDFENMSEISEISEISESDLEKEL
jgi:hypothetical protein